MNKLFVSLFASVLLLSACSDEKDILPDQRKKLVSYLTGTHTPRLVEESQVEPDGQEPFYSTSGSTVYRYISNYYNPDRKSWPVVDRNSVVTITFRMYVFTYTNIPDTRLPEFSNDPALENAYRLAGLDTKEWDFVPLVVDMRHGSILKGLKDALLGCRQGDEVETYMTYNMAYGDAYFSVIPKESPVAFLFTVDSVE